MPFSTLPFCNSSELLESDNRTKSFCKEKDFWSCACSLDHLLMVPIARVNRTQIVSVRDLITGCGSFAPLWYQPLLCFVMIYYEAFPSCAFRNAVLLEGVIRDGRSLSHSAGNSTSFRVTLSFLTLSICLLVTKELPIAFNCNVCGWGICMTSKSPR